MTKQTLLEKAKEIFSRDGFHGLSMRRLAHESGIAFATIYYHFPSKDDLLLTLFNSTNTNLGLKRLELPHRLKASEMLQDRIHFQLDNATDVMVVLNYYRVYRDTFKKNPEGFLPDKTYLHIEEVLDYGKKTGEFKTKSLKDDAKVITHAINGFIYEYYPNIPVGAERNRLMNKVIGFVLRGLKNE